MSPRKAKMGRPPKPRGEVKQHTFSIRLKPGEWEKIQIAAGALSPSEWARRVLLAAAA